MIKLSNPLLTRLRSEIIVPNVIDITGPMSGETNIAATILEALFSTKPNAASELKLKIKYVYGFYFTFNSFI